MSVTEVKEIKERKDVSSAYFSASTSAEEPSVDSLQDDLMKVLVNSKLFVSFLVFTLVIEYLLSPSLHFS
jgi:hypothetical protein